MFEIDAGGPLFLNEISNMYETALLSFLRVLETRKFQPVGGTTFLDANARVLAATSGSKASTLKLGTCSDRTSGPLPGAGPQPPRCTGTAWRRLRLRGLAQKPGVRAIFAVFRTAMHLFSYWPPKSFGEVEMQLQHHPGTRGSDPSERGPVVFHGHGAGKDETKDRVLRYWT
jgi:hypothetical protein